MSATENLAHPKMKPPLINEFRPPALFNRAFKSALAGSGVPLVIGLERSPGVISTYETKVYPDSHPGAPQNIRYTERIIKFLLWQRGGTKLYIGGPASIGKKIKKAYSPVGDRAFDYNILSQKIYEQPLNIIPCTPDDVPPANETGKSLGRHIDGCRIGFDLGASDRKVSAVMDGKVIFSEEVIWEPGIQLDPAYHYREIMSALKTAASKLPWVDAIGGSSAGIYIDNRPKVASLFRGIPPERFHEIDGIFIRIQEEMGVPLVVINDGDVTALAGSMSLGENGVLGIAMGSSEAAGYVDMDGNILGWLNELGFAPIDYSPNAAREAWSGDIGVGSRYFSQQCVFRLAPKVGIKIPEGTSNAEKLKYVQQKLESGHDGARLIWESIGVTLGYTLAHYADFYDFRHVLVLGRCTSGRGGDLIIANALKVIQIEFPELAAEIQVQLPDEKIRRVGQAIAAASLPQISKG